MDRALEVALTIAGEPVAFVACFEAIHEAGRPASFEIEVALGAYAELDELLGQVAELTFGFPDEAPRVLSGIVEEASIIGTSELGSEEGGSRYVLRISSRLGLLARSVGSRIFQEQTIPEIVTAILKDHGIDKVSLRLGESYRKRAYCVQYEESALAFIMRLCEHEGIYSFLAPGEAGSEGDETLVFADDSKVAPTIPGTAELPFRRATGSMGELGDAIFAIHEERRVRSGKFVLRDFDWKRPKLDLTSEATAKARTDLEVYDYPGGYFEPAEGKRLAKVRLEAEQVAAHTLRIEGTTPNVIVGHKLTLTDAGELDGDYFVHAAEHVYEHAGASRSGRASYVCRARLIPADVPYRAPQRTPVPVVEGPQTATVVAPASSPVESIHTDEHGRCKVKFHWDPGEATDDKAGCWLRVAQPQTSGSMMLPRIGWEVIVEFLEGNPDRPIVTGRLYNGTIMPPYALPEGKTRTSVKTMSTPGGGGSNEIRMEDKAGSEEIMIHAQHDMAVAVANNAKKTVGNNETTVVGNNADLKVSGNQTTKITKGAENTIGGTQTVSVGGNRSVEVNAVTAVTAHGSATISVGGNQFEMDGNPLEAMLALAAQAAEQFVNSLADNAVAAVQAHVDGAINQVMGPINNLNRQLQNVQNAMQQVANGDLGGVAGMVAGASGLPGAGAFGAQLAGGPGGGMAGRNGGGGGVLPGGTAMREGPGGGSAGAGMGMREGPGGGGGGEVVPRNGGGGMASPTNALAGMARGAAHQAVHQGVGAAHQALASALGLDAGGGGGASGANIAGPAGDVAGVDATDREKGPGHSTAKVTGAHTEKVGSLKVTAAVKDIDTNVKANKKVDVGAATVQFSVKDNAESVRGSKTEKALGLIVVSKAGESEQVGASKTTMVGGAIVDKLKGSHVVQAAGPATFIGAFHKVEAKTAIVLKCGGSEVVIDGGGVTITAPIVAFLAPKIQLPKKVSEV